MALYIATRVGEGMGSTFDLTVLKHSGGRADEWSTQAVGVPASSECMVIDGSGASSVRDALKNWGQSSAGGTSRAVFSGFVDAVTSGTDHHSGGTPQLGSIFRVGPGKLFGVVHRGQRYFAGARLLGNELLDGVDWRNSLFERLDGGSKKRLRDAQPQPRPVEL